MQQKTYSLFDLIEIFHLECTPQQALRLIRRLEKKHSFPSALPMLKAWSAPFVDQWINHNGSTLPETLSPLPPDDEPLDALIASIEQRYA